VINKIEAYPEDELEKLIDRFNKLFSGEIKEYGVVIKPLKLMTISAVTGEGTEELKHTLAEILREIPRETVETHVDEDTVAKNHDDSNFTIDKVYQKGNEVPVWMVSCGKLERIMRITDLRNLESLNHLFRVAKSLGLFHELDSMGAMPGDLINIDGVEFELNDVVLTNKPFVDVEIE